MTINELADEILRKNDDALARAFTLCIGKLLVENGIIPIIRRVEEPEQFKTDKNAYIIRKKYNVTFDGLDCTEHDKRISTWIPVSERLPKKGVQVLCCNKYGSVFTSCVTAKNRNNYKFGKHYDVIAWMPLPEPYRESEVENGEM